VYDIVTSVLLISLLQRLIDVTSFKLPTSLYSGSVPFKRTNDLGSVFTDCLYRRIYETKFPTHVSSLLSISYFMCQFHVLFLTLKPSLLLVTVSVTLSPVNQNIFQSKDNNIFNTGPHTLALNMSRPCTEMPA